MYEKIVQLKLVSKKDGKNYLTDVWKQCGIDKPIEYALLTNEIYKEIRKEALRDNIVEI